MWATPELKVYEGNVSRDRQWLKDYKPVILRYCVKAHGLRLLITNFLSLRGESYPMA